MKNFTLFLILIVSCSTVFGQKTLIPMSNILLDTVSTIDTSNVELLLLESSFVEKSTIDSAVIRIKEVKSQTPSNLADLTGGWDFWDYHLSLETAQKLSIVSVGDIGANYGKDVYVYDFMFYKDDKNNKGEKIKWGAGVRLVIIAKKLNSSANFSTLGAIAASAEVNMAEVSIRMKTIGISGTKINKVIPAAGAYDIEKHVEYLKAIDSIKALASDASTKVTPEIIEVEVESSRSELRSILVSHAFKMISKGKSYDTAIKKLKKKDGQLEEIVKGVYEGFINSSDDTKPTKIQKLQAKEIFKAAGLK